MREEDIPDKNVFMMCEALDPAALSEMPAGFTVRNCRPDELPIWKAMPFDDPATAKEYEGFMTDFFHATYGGKEDLFFATALFVCDERDRPVGTCFIWKAYDEFNTIHWFKVVKEHEGKGIGRALLSIVMKDLRKEDYPVYLHTQPASYRAIKLYSDFGFALLSGEKFGSRTNDLEEYLPILKEFMPKKHFEKLRITDAPEGFVRTLEKHETIEF